MNLESYSYCLNLWHTDRSIATKSNLECLTATTSTYYFCSFLVMCNKHRNLTFAAFLHHLCVKLKQPFAFLYNICFCFYHLSSQRTSDPACQGLCQLTWPEPSACILHTFSHIALALIWRTEHDIGSSNFAGPRIHNACPHFRPHIWLDYFCIYSDIKSNEIFSHKGISYRTKVGIWSCLSYAYYVHSCLFVKANSKPKDRHRLALIIRWDLCTIRHNLTTFTLVPKISLVMYLQLLVQIMFLQGVSVSLKLIKSCP